ncbi:hypothetical protein AVEN_231982-1 [Araneus ventricosus]|uniref:Uncharacterized protein n=1 Tax=Araneus ventricosus TaxID=182803 RepID=A0A4Y2C0A6_ARAVE|nr:hypothetical protein AVEN_231982-1 [Araneus ventricosus]
MICGVCTVQNGIHSALRSGIHAAVSFVLDSVINKITLTWVEQHVGRKLIRYHIGPLICDDWNKSATVGIATRGFKVTGIFPFNNNTLPDHLFYA